MIGSDQIRSEQIRWEIVAPENVRLGRGGRPLIAMIDDWHHFPLPGSRMTERTNICTCVYVCMCMKFLHTTYVYIYMCVVHMLMYMYTYICLHIHTPKVGTFAQCYLIECRSPSLGCPTDSKEWERKRCPCRRDSGGPRLPRTVDSNNMEGTTITTTRRLLLFAAAWAAGSWVGVAGHGFVKDPPSGNK